jgi:Holliday junction resolvasome RuvABC endonuclease subunit
MILGIDVSTSCTGFALLDENKKLIEASFCELSNYDDIFDKADVVRKEIERYISERKITAIAIEENLSSFRRGLSSAHTLITLARFNGIVCYMSHVASGIKPSIIPVNDARRRLGIRKAKKGEDAKELVKEWVDREVIDYVWPTKTMKSGPRKGEVVLEKGVQDAMDAYVMARAFLELKK